MSVKVVFEQQEEIYLPLFEPQLRYAIYLANTDSQTQACLR